MNTLSKMIINYIDKENLTYEELSNIMDDLKINVIDEYFKNDGKIVVIKRGGQIEEYKDYKIKRSIKNAADDYNLMVNTSDLDIIMDDINKKMDKTKRSVFRTYEIKDFVKEALTEEGFSKVCESYEKYIQNQGSI